MTNTPNSFYITIEKPKGPQQSWVNRDGESVEFPEYFDSLNDALKFYNSVYDENQLGRTAPTISMPIQEMLKGVHVLTDAALKAGTRTKEELHQRQGYSCQIL